MIKKNNKVLYISIVSISIIVIGIVIWGFLTNWKYWNHKNIPDQPVLPTYKSNVKIAKGVKIDINEPVKKGFKIGQEIQIGSGKKSEIRTIVGFGSLILDSPLKYDHPKGTVIKVIKQTPTDKFSTKYCETYNKNGDCQKCFFNLPSKNGICVPSDTCKTENNCKTCNKIGTKCETCKSGYIPVNDGKCCIQRKVYVSQEDGHNILKCCDKELCGDGDNKVCCGEKKCATQPNGNHLCCEGNFASNNNCCGNDQILDKHGVCCDKEKIDNNKICCKSNLLSGECKVKCGDSSYCYSDKQCNGNACVSKDCRFENEIYVTKYPGDNSYNIENCKLKVDGKTINNRVCSYPLYEYNDKYRKNKKFLYTIEDNSSINSNLKTGVQQTANHSCNISDINTENCDSVKGQICSKKKDAKILSDDENICPYEDNARCCKVRTFNKDTNTWSYGKYTGQVCGINEYCIQDINLSNGARLGTCYKKYCKQENESSSTNHLDCSNYNCGDERCYGTPVCKKTSDNGISYSYCGCEPPDYPICRE